MKLKELINEYQLKGVKEHYTKEEQKLKQLGISGAQALGNGKFKIKDDNDIDDGIYTIEQLELMKKYKIHHMKKMSNGEYEIKGDSLIKDGTYTKEEIELMKKHTLTYAKKQPSGRFKIRWKSIVTGEPDREYTKNEIEFFGKDADGFLSARELNNGKFKLGNNDKIYTKKELQLHRWFKHSNIKELPNGKFLVKKENKYGKLEDGIYTESELRFFGENTTFKNIKKLPDGRFNITGFFLGDPRHLPVKINIFKGTFICSGKGYSKLENCPEIIEGKFSCTGTNIETLEGTPKIVKGDFYFERNKKLKSLKNIPKIEGDISFTRCDSLESLEGAPKVVKGSFFCSNCNLKTLNGAPKIVEGDFYCDKNPNLQSLEGGPETVEGNFYCDENPNLQSLEGGPETVGGDFYCDENPNLKSLKGCPKYVGGDFRGENIGIKVSFWDVKDVCDVKGEIYVDEDEGFEDGYFG